ncbi:MAG: CHASE domain-containing protein [Gammaproteobacteria bacterium]|nr:CHASE domain-containing protein [Gammaproteobacteria bacterium]
MERRLRTAAAAVLAGGLVLSAVATGALFGTLSRRDHQTFEANARIAEGALHDRVETSIALLRGAAGLLASQGGEVTVRSFRAYMDQVALREQYPGILGIGFSRRILPAERAALERQMRAQGQRGFRVWPEHDAEESHAIVFLEPLDARNRAAIGYDMSTEHVRRAAMARARDSGEAAASGVVELVQEIDEQKQPGFLIYLPVYRGGVVPETTAERRERLIGFAYAPVRAGDFLSSAFTREPPSGLAFSVYQGPRVDPSTLLYELDPGPAPDAPRFVLTSTAEVAGDIWTFEFRSLTTAARALVLPALVGLTGMLVTMLVALVLWREARARSAVHDAFEREQAARRQAERANRMKDQFLAMLSHELRTPLNAIVGWAAVLRRGGLSEEQRQKGLDVVARNAKAQARLIDDLLDMNRVASGKLGMNVEIVDAASVVEDAVAAVASDAQAKGIEIGCEIPERPVLIRGDAARLQQVYWNLLSNAVKFTPQSGRVRVALERTAAEARLTVADTGEGIEPELLEHIFDRFAQADGSITRRHGGLGLGLAIARELVALHGGRIRADSEGAGRGATFVVELPLADGAAAAVAPEIMRDVSLDGVRILVVDDEADVRDLVRVILAQHGAEVCCVGSAQAALDALDVFDPDVLVSDIGMPGMNGYELIRELRRRSGRAGKLPALALTAYVRDEDRSDAIAAGYQAHVGKPLRPDELLAAIASLRGGSADAARRRA